MELANSPRARKIGGGPTSNRRGSSDAAVRVLTDPLRSLRDASADFEYYRNQTIFNEGDAARYTYVVISGGVRLSKIRRNGRRQIVRFLLPGDMFGLECEDEHSLSAEALCDTMIARCGHSDVNRLSRDASVLSHEIMRRAQRELASMRDHLVMLGRHTATEKVAAFLLLLNRPDGAASSNKLELPMGRQDIADFLGLTIETVCRELTLLTQNGTIEIPSRHQIVLVNLTRLKIAREGCET